jgi:hypothetical protein
LRPPSTEAPSLPRRYPASSVVRASPPSQSARPVSRELPVDPDAITAGTSRVAYGPLGLHAVANTPAGRMEPSSLLPFPPLRPSPFSGRVGSCINGFEACSAFTHVTACMLAKSPLRLSGTRGFSSLVASTAALIATGWSEPVPGRVNLPLWTTAFSRRTRESRFSGLGFGGRRRTTVTQRSQPLCVHNLRIGKSKRVHRRPAPRNVPIYCPAPPKGTSVLLRVGRPNRRVCYQYSQ